MRIVFFGTGDFSIAALKKLVNSKHELIAVVTQPDSKKGRGFSTMPAPVKSYMEKAAPEIEILEPANPNSAEFLDYLKSKEIDLFVVIDYGKILSSNLLKVPRECAVNLHPSLLPKYRGPSPVNYAILNGEVETGVSVIKMDEGVDSGEIIIREKTAIGENETAPLLLERLSRLGAELILKCLDMIADGAAVFEEQDGLMATYAPKLEKKDGKIDWSSEGEKILLMTRALQPWPGAFTYIDGKTLKIFKASIVDYAAPAADPGTVVNGKEFIVKTGDGFIEIHTLQLEGKRIMQKNEFVRGYDVNDGNILG